MAKAKKTLSLVMAVLMMAFTFLSYVPAKAAEVTSANPEIAWVGLEHSPLVAGESETFTISTKNADKVQYQITLKSEATGAVEDITKGWTSEVAGNGAYAVTPEKKFELGKYDFTVSAKRVSDGKVATYTAKINVVSKDDANRVYTTGAVDIAKAEYAVGEKITVNGVKDLAGIAGPYLYKLNVYNVTTGEWLADAQKQYKSNIEWTPSQAGTYALLIYVNSEKSTTWAKYTNYLNLANPTSLDRRGTYEGWKYVVVNVTDALKVTDVKAPNQKTVKVTFNRDLGTVEPINFSIAEKDDQYSLINIEKVAVDKNVATITTYDSLSDGTSYVLTTTDVPSADGKQKLATATNEFKYVDVTDIASIAFKATSFAPNDEIGLVIKDKNGNDITPNFDLADILEVETSNESVVSYANGVLTAGTTTGKAIVNVAVTDADVETGNTIITVSDTLQAIASIGAADIDEVASGYSFDYDEPSLAMYESDVNSKINFEVLNQDGDTLEATTESAITKEFKSLTPSVLAVDTNLDANNDGEISDAEYDNGATLIPLKAGSAQVLLKATFKDKTVSKVVTVTVKGEKVATSLKVDKTSVKVVGGSGIEQTVTAKLYDQYGKEMDLASGDVTVSVKNDDASLIAFTNNTTDGALEVTATPGSGTDTTATKTVTLTYENGDITLKTSFTASLVKPGDFAGYAAVANDTKLDLYAANEDDLPSTSAIRIYEKDVNGNYIGEVTLGEKAVLLETSNDKVETTTSGSFTVTALETGTSTVTVKVGTTTGSAVKVGTITFTVVDSEPVATTFKQTKATIVADNDNNVDIFNALFGTDGAFSAKDQYGDNITITASDVDVYSTNTSLVTVSGATITTSTTNTGTVKLIVVADKTYEISVVVEQ